MQKSIFPRQLFYAASMITFAAMLLCTLQLTSSTKAILHAPKLVAPSKAFKLKTQKQHDILQFRAGGHLLGFQQNSAHLVGLDHVLSIEFLGTPGVMPKSAIKEDSTETDSLSLGKVLYEQLWEGIDLVYESTANGIAESTFQVAPGADISNIRLRYNVPLEMQTDGSIQFRFPSGHLTESTPVAWQEIGGKRVPIDVSFKINGQEVGFSLGQYDLSHPLIIDPTYEWHRFYGSDSNSRTTDIALDADGNLYVIGSANAAWSGPNGEAPLHAYASDHNMFILKLTSSGEYQWHTYFGPTLSKSTIALDGGGNLYVIGSGNAGWSGPNGESPLRAYT